MRMAGVADPAAIAAAILRQRDSAADEGKPASHDALECPFCMVRYAEDESEQHVPRILQCGHTGCQGCFAQMLRPIVADGDLKKLECPMCREVTEVKRGKAGNLLKNFSLLC